jgi:hypothetical protein
LYDYAGTGVSRILVEAGTNSGISFRSKGTGDFSFINDTTTRVTIKSDGKVGIGTGSPVAPLDILDSGTGGNGEKLVLRRSGAGDVGLSFQQNGVTAFGIVARSGAGNGLAFVDNFYERSAGTERVRILNNGNVGIGTTVPRNGLELAKLDSNYITSLRVGGITSGNSAVPIGSETSRHQILFSSWRDVVQDTVGAKIVAINKNAYQENSALVQHTDLAFFTLGSTTADSDDTTEKMRITSGGNVGIGTTSPGYKLSVAGAIQGQETTGSGDVLIIGNDTKLVDINVANTVGLYGLQDSTVASLKLGSGGGTVSGYSGNVGIGTTSPVSILEIGNYGWMTINAIQSTAGINFYETGTKSSTSIQYGGTIYYNGGGDAFVIGTRENSTTKIGLSIARTSGYVSFPNGHGDLAENYIVSGEALRGSIISVNRKLPGRAIMADQNNDSLIGVVSTKPGAVMDVDGDFQIGIDTKVTYRDEKVPVGLTGLVPVLVTSENGNIQTGDYIGISSIPGYGSRMTNSGPTVGKALEPLKTTNCEQVTTVNSINWPKDDGKNSVKPCFKLPDGNIVGKVLVAVNVSWYDPISEKLFEYVKDKQLLTIKSTLGPENNTYDLGTTENRWKDIYTQGTINLGNTTDNGSIRFNPDTKRLEFSNDGTNWIPFGSSTYTDLLAVQYPGSIVLEGTNNNTGDITTNNTGIGNGSMNYYQWNSPGNVINSKEINIRYQLPSNFREWGSGGITLSFATESTNSVENKVDMYVYEQSSTSYDVISENNVSTTSEQWQTIEIDSSQLTMCNKAEDVCIIKIKMSSSLDNYVRVGDIKIKYERTL